MNVRAFIPKDDQELPDQYGLTIHYIDGKSEVFEVASHALSDQSIEFVTFEDVWNRVPMTSIKRIEFDKRFSKIVAIKQEKDKDA
jgi:hypothetical protein